MALSDLHQRIASTLQWPLEEVQSFSLPTLRELIRPLSSKLVHEISSFMRSAEYVARPSR